MAIPIITQKTEEEKANELGAFLNQLQLRQNEIINVLGGFRADLVNLATVLQSQKDEIAKLKEEMKRVDRRNRNKAKRGGQDVDNDEG